ncbi:MAG: formate dehydrogenase accessory sulfurtransferase FdhD [Chloroflexi bacterium]|nr:MAG: formate dehydrogenase accessory sulfurtransferase FdhD [Chloroflexota bacterium]TMG51764.1 MAG: formate dehydrogenase accessory sulfurtransferase FdhD [Chloroflexota bacterium]
MPRPQAPPVQIARWRAGDWRDDSDQVAAEEPLQLSLDGKPLSIVMRTPGNDLELALGLLWAEQVIRSLDDVARVRISAEAQENEPRVAVANDLVESNQVDVYLRGSAGRRPERSFLATSACGVCGATTVESLALDFAPLAAGPTVGAAMLPRLSDRLRVQQRIFESTGGLHAAGLFDERGELQLLREDIGRHNAVDKVVGRALLDGRLPLERSVLAVSGRAGYEVVQKAVAAGIPILAAVGAPSSLAVATAERFGMTLVGFLRDDRFNVYTSPERIGR